MESPLKVHYLPLLAEMKILFYASYPCGGCDSWADDCTTEDDAD
jgi:hypothetical protein